MAILKTVQTAFGLEVVDAHHRVENVALVAKNKISFQVRSRVDAGQEMVFNEMHVECQYDINGENPIAQAYAYLKTLDEFADAVDC